MDKDNCLYIQNVCSYKSSGILFELKVIRATTCIILFFTIIQKPTQLSGFIFGGPLGPSFELYYCRIIFSKISSKY
jgi:hypothetical protein